MTIILNDDSIRDKPITMMTSEEVADVARLGSDINSLAPPTQKPNLSTGQVRLFETNKTLTS